MSLTVLLPVTREWTRAAFCEALAASDVPRDRLVLVLDAPGCEAWEPALAALGFAVETHKTGNPAPLDASSPRPRRARQGAMRAFTCGLVPDGSLLCLDDDAVVPPDVYARLSSAGLHATGVQVGRYGRTRRCGVYRRGRSLSLGTGVEPVEQCGHYCLLTTGEMYRNTAVQPDMKREGCMLPIPGLVVDWDCVCGHLTEDGILWP